MDQAHLPHPDLRGSPERTSSRSTAAGGFPLCAAGGTLSSESKGASELWGVQWKGATQQRSLASVKTFGGLSMFEVTEAATDKMHSISSYPAVRFKLAECPGEGNPGYYIPFPLCGRLWQTFFGAGDRSNGVPGWGLWVLLAGSLYSSSNFGRTSLKSQLCMSSREHWKRQCRSCRRMDVSKGPIMWPLSPTWMASLEESVPLTSFDHL